MREQTGTRRCKSVPRVPVYAAVGAPSAASAMLSAAAAASASAEAAAGRRESATALPGNPVYNLNPGQDTRARNNANPAQSPNGPASHALARPRQRATPHSRRAVRGARKPARLLRLLRGSRTYAGANRTARGYEPLLGPTRVRAVPYGSKYGTWRDLIFQSDYTALYGFKCEMVPGRGSENIGSPLPEPISAPSPFTLLYFTLQRARRR